MVRKLYANYFLWTRDDANYKVQQGTAEQPLTLFNQRPSAVAGTDKDEGSMMPTSGLFVGMIIFVTTNTQDVSTVTFTVQAKEPGADNWKILGSIDILPGETGCFYTDPDTSDAVRSYAEYSILKITTEAAPGSFGAEKIDKVSIMIGLETESGRFGP